MSSVATAAVGLVRSPELRRDFPGIAQCKHPPVCLGKRDLHQKDLGLRSNITVIDGNNCELAIIKTPK